MEEFADADAFLAHYPRPSLLRRALAALRLYLLRRGIAPSVHRLRISRISLFAVLALVAAPPAARSADSLAQARTVYVDRLGHSDVAALVREKLINLLARSKVLSPVDDPARADVRLTGVVAVHTWQRFAALGTIAAGGTYESASMILRLLDSDNGILWTFEGLKRCKPSVTDCAARDLIKAVEKARKPTMASPRRSRSK